MTNTLLIRIINLSFIILVICHLFWNSESSSEMVPNVFPKLSFQEIRGDSLKRQKAEKYYRKAKSLLDENKNDSISFYLEKAIAVNDSLEIKQENFSNSIAELATKYYHMVGDYKASIDFNSKFLETLKAHKDWDRINISYTLSSLAKDYLMLGNYSAALSKGVIPNEKLLEELLMASDNEETTAYLKVGMLSNYNYSLLLNMNLGDSDRIKEELNKIEKLLNSITEFKPSNKPFIEDIYTSIIDLNIKSGNYSKAKTFIDYYKTLYKSPSTLAQLRIIDKERKLAFHQGKFDTAIIFHDKSEDVFKSKTKPNLYELHYYRLSLDQYAGILMKEGYSDYSKAIAVNKESINLLKGQKTVFNNNSYAYANLAELYQKTEKIDSAKFYFDLAIKETETLKLYGRSAVNHLRKTVFYVEDLGDKSYANIGTEKILQTLGIKDIQSLDKVKNEILNVRSHGAFAKTVLRLAGLHFQIFKEESEKTHLVLSHDLYLLASQILSKSKLENKLNELEVELLNKVNNGLLETLNELNEFGLKYDRLKATIERLEANQNVELHLKNAQNGIVLNNSKIPKALEDLRYRLEQEDIKVRAQLLEADSLDKSTISNITRDRQNLGYRLDSIYAVINKLSPEYGLYNQSHFDLDQVRSQLDAKTKILRYFFSDSILYEFKVEKDAVNFKAVDDRIEIDAMLNKAHTSLSLNSAYDVDTLSEVLTASFDTFSKGETVIIIPHLNLNLIPFEVLQYDDTFLIERFNLSYGNSLFSVLQSEVSDSNVKLACFAPNYENNNQIDSEFTQQLVRDGIYELEGAQKEVKAINRLFEGDLFLNQEASKTNFVQKAQDYSILHLAMHAVVDPNEANNTMLLFTKDSDNSILRINDIYNLEINSSLTVLSACNTGKGKLDASEGVLSLSRAFQYAGSSSNVMSLWKVPDEQTASLMTGFYEYLKQGESKNTALRNAKLDYLNSVDDPNLKHPYYWAGFVLSGDISAVSSNSNYVWYFIGFFVLTLLFFVLKRRKDLS